MADVKIFTSRKCGWAIRNYAALLEKGVEFDTVSAVNDDGNKTDEFVAATPFLQTPVLVHGNTQVFESTLINLYVDDRFEQPPLLPASSTDRIEAHKWIHYADTQLIPQLSVIARAADAAIRTTAIKRWNSDLDWFASNPLSEAGEGPYFFGDLFSLLDIAFYTVFSTVRSLESILEESLVLAHPALKKWEVNVMQRPSIRQAAQIQEQLTF